jgi:protein gp37
MDVPARIHFISAEPLLGSLSIRQWKHIDWVIAGGESGHGARPTDPNWIRSLRDECHSAGIAFHFKQWGHWAPELPHGATPRQRLELASAASTPTTLYGLGKAMAGRLLDGRTWDQFPA